MQEQIRALLRGCLDHEDVTLEKSWKQISDQLVESAINILGTKRKEHKDWFMERDSKIETLLDERNRAHHASKNNHSSAQLRQRFAELRAAAIPRLGELDDSWWQDLVAQIEGCVDTNNT